MKNLFKNICFTAFFLVTIVHISNVQAKRISMNLMEHATFIPATSTVPIQDPRSLNSVKMITPADLVAEIAVDYGLSTMYPAGSPQSFVVIGEIKDQSSGDSLGNLIGMPEFTGGADGTFTGNVYDLFIFKQGGHQVLTQTQDTPSGDGGLEIRDRLSPFLDPNDSSILYTHTSSFYSDVIGGTGPYKNATGFLRLNGNLDLQNFFVDGTGILNCIFILDVETNPGN